MKYLPLLFLVLAVSVANSRIASASELNVGGMVGYSSIDASNEFGVGNGSLGFGARAGLNLIHELDAAAEWTFTSTTPSGTTTGYSSNFSVLVFAADFSARLASNKFRFFLGPKGGIGWTSAGGYKGSSAVIGGEVGADVFVGTKWSVGAELSYLHAGAPTVNGVVGNSGTLIQALGVLKYWL